jgi:hypothetical protein
MDIKNDIKNYTVDENVKDNDGKTCVIKDITSNSLNVWIGKKSKKGIDSTNWFSLNDFEKRFKKAG